MVRYINALDDFQGDNVAGGTSDLPEMHRPRLRCLRGQRSSNDSATSGAVNR